MKVENVVRVGLFLFSLTLGMMVSLSLRCQESLGLVNGNYADVNGLMINPANASVTRPNVTINLFSGDFFFQSNFFFVHKKDYRFGHFFNLDASDPKYEYVYDYPEYDYKDSLQYLDYFKNSDRKKIYVHGRIGGPSATIRIGRHAFSLVTGFRNHASGEDIPYDIATFMYRGFDFVPQHDITWNDEGGRIAALSWIEIGLGYSVTFYKDREQEVSGGITAKYLLGTGGAYARIDNARYRVPDSDTLIVENMNATVAIDFPINNATSEFPDFNPLVRGTGWSGDIGFTYVRKGWLSEEHHSLFGDKDQMEKSYWFRAGISLLDVGKINFTKSVEVHEFRNVNNAVWPGIASYTASSVQELLRSASYHLLGDSMASLSDQNRFTIYLPTAYSIQLDYNFGHHLYANATFVNGLPLGEPAVRRPSLISLTPRWETKELEVNLPMTLYDFREPTIGLALRIYSLVIGTEKLGTFLHLTDVKGVDLYFSLGIKIDAPNLGWPRRGPRGPCDSYENYKRYQVN